LRRGQRDCWCCGIAFATCGGYMPLQLRWSNATDFMLRGISVVKASFGWMLP